MQSFNNIFPCGVVNLSDHKNIYVKTYLNRKLYARTGERNVRGYVNSIELWGLIRKGHNIILDTRVLRDSTHVGSKKELSQILTSVLMKAEQENAYKKNAIENKKNVDAVNRIIRSGKCASEYAEYLEKTLGDKLCK